MRLFFGKGDRRFLIKMAGAFLTILLGVGGTVGVRADDAAKNKVPDIAQCEVEQNELDYNGQSQKVPVIVNDKYGNLLTEGKDYQIIYGKDSASIGEHEATVHFVGRYEGKQDQTINYSIVPKAAIVKKSKVKKHSFTVVWNKVEGAQYYEVTLHPEYASLQRSRTKKVKKTSITFKGLQSGSKYKVYVNPCTKDEIRNIFMNAIDDIEYPDDGLLVKTKGKYIAPGFRAKVLSPKTAKLSWRPEDDADQIRVYVRKKNSPNVRKETKYKKIAVFNGKKESCKVKLPDTKCYEYKLVQYKKKGKKYKKTGDTKVLAVIGKQERPSLSGYSGYEGKKERDYRLTICGSIENADYCIQPDYYEIYKKEGNQAWKKIKKYVLSKNKKNKTNDDDGSYLFDDKDIRAGVKIQYKVRGARKVRGKIRYTKFSKVYTAGTLYARQGSGIKAEIINRDLEDTNELTIKVVNNSQQNFYMNKYSEEYNEITYKYGWEWEAVVPQAYSYDGKNYQPIVTDGLSYEQKVADPIVAAPGKSVYIRFKPMYKDSSLGTVVSLYKQCELELNGSGTKDNMCGTMILDFKNGWAYSCADDWE